MSAGECCQKIKQSGLSSLQETHQIDQHYIELLKKWQVTLDLTGWVIVCQAISEMQVVDALKGDIPGHEFVGVTIDLKGRRATIYHTRPMREDDVIHELLHVRYPQWSEERVNFWTDLLMRGAEPGPIESEGFLVAPQYTIPDQ